MSLWKRGRQVLDGLHGRRPALSEAARHDEPAGCEAPRARVDRRGRARAAGRLTSKARSDFRSDRRIPGCQADSLLAAHDRTRGGTTQLRQEALRRRAALRNHCEGDRGVPAHAARCRHREPHHQHGRRRAVAGAQVLRTLASARGSREELARAPASGRPRTDARGAEATVRRCRVESQSGSTCIAQPSLPPTRRCGRSR